MVWPDWSIDEPEALARYVLPETAEQIPLGLIRDDAILRNERIKVVQAIYEALSNRDLHYSREMWTPVGEPQIVRHPGAILDGSGNATCLDLALLFASVCLGHELVPLVVIVHGHAFVAVSLLDDPRVPDSRQRVDRDGAWIDTGVLRDGKLFMKLVAEKTGHYVPIECTGFAKSYELLDGYPEGTQRNDGKLDFSSAVAAARTKCDARQFRFAVDPALRQRIKKVSPYRIPSASSGSLIGCRRCLMSL
jgi:hypothetical protein